MVKACSSGNLAWIDLLGLLLMQKQHQEALGEYFQAYRLAPDHPVVLLSIATTLTNQSMSPSIEDRDRTVMQAFAFMQASSSPSLKISACSEKQLRHEYYLIRLWTQMQQDCSLRSPGTRP